MRIINFGFIVLLCCAACHQEQKKQDTSAKLGDTVQSTQPLDTGSFLTGKSTYQYLKNGDTISLSITVDGEKVQGDLSYAWKEKDRNKGHIDGVLKGDILTADYTFSSEGQESVRQVIFKLSKERALEGYGAMEEKAGKMTFADPKKIAFDEKFALENLAKGQ
ncbi:hypothetical protein HS960_11310 [Sphingobacterium paramultivorum]|uniref:Uncharacterized protein n=1 Tax=Sphingobacterium paramultivorum TaxID=2886510 RepID=A0A7G5E2I6_9SPHI|nr:MULTISPECIES: hypothetical protein [Sphingobacterium]MCS4165661.1 hypothetical protein [Sphingobacterium sp. BIGb0116]QMV68211.1 hypothetical protein HS960_11310 [Sphingobacterium paramultivorum]WET69139.1 MAG: hypothetical protein P0Y57_25175 [Sphingobacterium sp.]WSO17128.1 hypothetical protein VUL84_11295 [Sphingobacterium paramultivorum]